ncbi:MAG: CHAT domain-containing protein [Nitrospirota bacterium]
MVHKRRPLTIFGCWLLISLSAGGLTAEPMTAAQQQEAGWQAYRRGAFNEAIVSWQEAAAVYERESSGPARSDVLVLIAEAYEALGRHPKAAEQLNEALRLAAQIGDARRQARILNSRGALALAVGDEAEAERSLAEALRLAKELNHPGLLALIQNNVGNLSYARSQYAEAVKAYEESVAFATTAGNHSLTSRSRINLAQSLSHLDRHGEAKGELDRAFADLRTLQSSHDQAFALITIGLTYDRLRAHLPDAAAELMTSAFQAFQAAAESAESIGDHRSASYAWGYLARLYESERRDQDALELTRRAILSAQQAVAPEALYRWHWQAGRLFTRLDLPVEALAAYRRAVFALQSVRAELLTASGPSSASFRDSAGAVYYELADLLLQQAARISDRARTEPYLKEARDVVELLKADELRNYFGDECVDAARSRITSLEAVATTAAIVYPVILPDRLELLVSLPDGLHRVAVPVGAEPLTREIRAFRHFLEKRTTNEYLPHAQQVYDWVIRPLLPLLEGRSITTLVFVPDGPLRTIPMAALHDGTTFLISRYAVATTPGLTLTDPRPLKRQAIQALSAGLSEAVQGFAPLPNVAEEVQTVNRLFGGNMLLNRDFLVPRVERELREKPFAVVHIASHGQFENDVRKSFVLAYDDKLTMDRLDRFVGLMRFREEPLALLTLSACETAAGDDRAALGLAGVAIKAGARSALATLWSINDESSTMLVTEFYRELRDPSLSKAAALQRAQLNMLGHPMYRHPAYWAPFLLLNNWL